MDPLVERPVRWTHEQQRERFGTRGSGLEGTAVDTDQAKIDGGVRASGKVRPLVQREGVGCQVGGHAASIGACLARVTLTDAEDVPGRLRLR